MSEKHENSIMIIDDETSIVEMLVEVMDLAGYQSEGFTRPHEALRAFKENPNKYKMVITDLTMPGLTGDELAIEIKKINPGCMVVLSTGYQPDLKAGQFKNFLVLLKPFEIEGLLKLVRENFQKG